MYNTQTMNILWNMIRGALIGMAELVPGVSGGTIALVTGVYERVLYNANLVLDGIKSLVKDRSSAGEKFKAVDWKLLIPLAVGMGIMVLTMAGVLESFVTDQPQASRGLFFGMVLVSISVPIMMVDKAELRAKAVKAGLGFAIAAIGTFLLTGLTSAPQENPNLLWVFFAAAIAVCALVLPGVSGSFFLLAVGLYSATMSAVDNLNVAYLGVFALGAITGLISFVRLLEHLLTTHRTVTLIVMSGLMFGSLRALWPWQTGDAELLAPNENIGIALILFVVGALAVLAMLVAERMFATPPTPPQEETARS